MKKVLAMVLAFCLLCGSTSALAVTYTMPEKLSRQLVIGSGLKGSFVLNAEGSSGAAAVLSVLNGAEIQVRGMASDEDWHYYFYQTDEAENQWARTDLQRKDGNVYLRSDLLKEDRILMLPAVENALDTLTRGSEGTPSFASAVWRLFRMSDGTREDIWNPMVALLGERLENWLTPYAQEPAVKQTDDGQAVIEMGYVIPAEDLKQGILDGLELVTGNQELMTLAADMTTEEQQETYLNPYLRYFYQQALDQLILPFDVSLSRTVSTLGSTLSSVIELPLDEEKTGYSALVLETEGDSQKVTLSRSDRELTVIWNDGSLKEDGRFSLWVIDRQEGDGPSTARRIDLTRKLDSWEDEETRSHERYTYTIDITGDLTRISPEDRPEQFQEIPEQHGEAELHFYSKYAQSSPTTLEIKANWQGQDESIALDGKIKSASPWVYSPFDIADPQNLLDMSADERNALWLGLLSGAAEKILPNAPEKTPEPETTPEPEAAPEPETAPEPEETAAAADASDGISEIPAADDNTPAPETEQTDTEAAGESAAEDSAAGESDAPDPETDASADEDQASAEEDPSELPEMTASPESDG